MFPESCPIHNFIRHDGISELYDRIDYHDKKMCRMQEPCRLLEDYGHTVGVNFVHRLYCDIGSCSICNFVLHDGFSNFKIIWDKLSSLHENMSFA